MTAPCITFAPEISEQIARPRADLPMRVPVVLTGPGADGALMIAAETVDAGRLAKVRAQGASDLMITGRRAETLRASAFGGDLAPVFLPSDATLSLVRSISSPADDRRSPMKVPLRTLRDGNVDLHRAAIVLTRAAGM